MEILAKVEQVVTVEVSIFITPHLSSKIMLFLLTPQNMVVEFISEVVPLLF
jgi:hypothetical protein